MLKMEEWLMLRDLYRQGLSISQIARQTGHDRKTVRTYVKSGELPVPKERAKKGSKLDAFKDYIVNKLKEGSFTASRLFKEIQEIGFTGKYTIVKDFVREVRPKQVVQAIYRYETKPEVQAQVDWSEFGKVEINGKILKRKFSTI